ncbi:hypothetical protein ACFYZ5_44230 [Streptomyces chartreusis]|uniref:hypothetical protein n=1 Tax=Streptomyces chartreusis TaxID=1969 RepID=UPI00367CB723
MDVSRVEIDLPDGLIHVWDVAHETTGLPAAEYLRLGAVHLPPVDGSDAPARRRPLTRTGSLWGDLAFLIDTVRNVRDA